MKIRERIFARDMGLCQCEECQSGTPKPAGEVDHIIPLSDGGTDDDSNLQSLSVECHEKKTRRELDARQPGKLFVEGKPDPLPFLLAVMHDNEADPKLRVRAAIAAAQYKHTKRSDGGKKEDAERAAKKAGSGKFRPAAAPRLVVNNT